MNKPGDFASLLPSKPEESRNQPQLMFENQQEEPHMPEPLTTVHCVLVPPESGLLECSETLGTDVHLPMAAPGVITEQGPQQHSKLQAHTRPQPPVKGRDALISLPLYQRSITSPASGPTGALEVQPNAKEVDDIAMTGARINTSEVPPLPSLSPAADTPRATAAHPAEACGTPTASCPATPASPPSLISASRADLPLAMLLAPRRAAAMAAEKAIRTQQASESGGDRHRKQKAASASASLSPVTAATASATAAVHANDHATPVVRSPSGGGSSSGKVHAPGGSGGKAGGSKLAGSKAVPVHTGDEDEIAGAILGLRSPQSAEPSPTSKAAEQHQQVATAAAAITLPGREAKPIKEEEEEEDAATVLLPPVPTTKAEVEEGELAVQQQEEQPADPKQTGPAAPEAIGHADGGLNEHDVQQQGAEPHFPADTDAGTVFPSTTVKATLKVEVHPYGGSLLDLLADIAHEELRRLTRGGSSRAHATAGATATHHQHHHPHNAHHSQQQAQAHGHGHGHHGCGKGDDVGSGAAPRIPPAKKYRGVDQVGTRWRARLTLSGNQVLIGYFGTATEAALAYDRYVHEQGLDRPLNFPGGPEEAEQELNAAQAVAPASSRSKEIQAHATAWILDPQQQQQDQVHHHKGRPRDDGLEGLADGHPAAKKRRSEGHGAAGDGAPSVKPSCKQPAAAVPAPAAAGMGGSSSEAQPQRVKFKGVREARKGCWQARVCQFNKIFTVGFFKSAVEAARAYDREVIARSLALSSLNFPQEALALGLVSREQLEGTGHHLQGGHQHGSSSSHGNGSCSHQQQQQQQHQHSTHGKQPPTAPAGGDAQHSKQQGMSSGQQGMATLQLLQTKGPSATAGSHHHQQQQQQVVRVQLMQLPQADGAAGEPRVAVQLKPLGLAGGMALSSSSLPLSKAVATAGLAVANPCNMAADVASKGAATAPGNSLGCSLEPSTSASSIESLGRRHHPVDSGSSMETDALDPEVGPDHSLESTQSHLHASNAAAMAHAAAAHSVCTEDVKAQAIPSAEVGPEDRQLLLPSKPAATAAAMLADAATVNVPTCTSTSSGDSSHEQGKRRPANHLASSALGSAGLPTDSASPCNSPVRPTLSSPLRPGSTAEAAAIPGSSPAASSPARPSCSSLKRKPAGADAIMHHEHPGLASHGRPPLPPAHSHLHSQQHTDSSGALQGSRAVAVAGLQQLHGEGGGHDHAATAGGSPGGSSKRRRTSAGANSSSGGAAAAVAAAAYAAAPTATATYGSPDAMMTDEAMAAGGGSPSSSPSRMKPKFRGVYFIQRQQRWIAQLHLGGNSKVNGGYYVRPEDAARAYDRLALAHGRSDLNFPEEHGLPPRAQGQQGSRAPRARQQRLPRPAGGSPNQQWQDDAEDGSLTAMAAADDEEDNDIIAQLPRSMTKGQRTPRHPATRPPQLPHHKDGGPAPIPEDAHPAAALRHSALMPSSSSPARAATAASPSRSQAMRPGGSPARPASSPQQRRQQPSLPSSLFTSLAPFSAAMGLMGPGSSIRGTDYDSLAVAMAAMQHQHQQYPVTAFPATSHLHPHPQGLHHLVMAQLLPAPAGSQVAVAGSSPEVAGSSHLHQLLLAHASQQLQQQQAPGSSGSAAVTAATAGGINHFPATAYTSSSASLAAAGAVSGPSGMMVQGGQGVLPPLFKSA